MRGDAAAVLLDDALANRQPEAGARRLAVADKRLEETFQDFRRDAASGVGDFRVQGIVGHAEANGYFSAVRHGLGGVDDEVVKDTLEPRWIERQPDGRRRLGHLDDDGFARGFLAKLLDDGLHEDAVILGHKHDGVGIAAGEFQDVVHHAGDAIHLARDALLGVSARLERGRVGAAHLGGDADDGKGILQVVNDGTGEAPDQRHAFGQEHFAQVLLVELAQAPADFLEQRHAQSRRAREQRHQIRARHKIDNRLSRRRRTRGARLIVEHRHLAEEIPRLHSREGDALAGADDRGDLHLARLHDVHAVAGIAFLEDFLARREAPLLRHGLQRLQLVRR